MSLIAMRLAPDRACGDAGLQNNRRVEIRDSAADAQPPCLMEELPIAQVVQRAEDGKHQYQSAA